MPIKKAILIKNTLLFALLCASLFFVYRFGQASVSTQENPQIGGHVIVQNSNHPDRPKWIEQVSWAPRSQVFRNFVSPEECQYIISRGEPHLTRSMVAGRDGMDVQSDHRTSMGAFLTFLRDDPVIIDIERRIAEWVHIPAENGEIFYLLRYEPGQQYKPHHDYFSDQVWIREHGNRIATVLVYLGAPEEGGETAFPMAGIEVPVRLGDALLFWDYKPDMQPDETSLHQGKTVKKGMKWCMTKWIRMRKFHN